MVPRDEHTTRGNQARLAPMQDIQGRLGPKRRMERRRKEGNANPDTKAYWSRNRKGKDGSGLGGKKGTSNMLPVWKERTLHE